MLSRSVRVSAMKRAPIIWTAKKKGPLAGPLRAHAAARAAAQSVVVVGRSVEVVVVVALQVPSAAQASQQLGKFPTQPPLASHDPSARRTPHLLWPWPLWFERQQVTKPGLPQVERAAHFFTAPLQLLGSTLAVTSSFACLATQL